MSMELGLILELKIKKLQCTVAPYWLCLLANKIGLHGPGTVWKLYSRRGKRVQKAVMSTYIPHTLCACKLYMHTQCNHD